MKKDIPMINKIIKDKRKELRLTQIELAKLINKSIMTVRRYERGDLIPTNTLILCCEALGIKKSDVGLKKDDLIAKMSNYYLIYIKEQKLIYKKIIKTSQKLDLRNIKDIFKNKEVLKVELITLEEI